MATGVASPSAQGQLITSTETARFIANPIDSPETAHTMKVISEIEITTQTTFNYNSKTFTIIDNV